MVLLQLVFSGVVGNWEATSHYHGFLREGGALSALTSRWQQSLVVGQFVPGERGHSFKLLSMPFGL